MNQNSAFLDERIAEIHHCLSGNTKELEQANKVFKKDCAVLDGYMEALAGAIPERKQRKHKVIDGFREALERQLGKKITETEYQEYVTIGKRHNII